MDQRKSPYVGEYRRAYKAGRYWTPLSYTYFGSDHKHFGVLDMVTYEGKYLFIVKSSRLSSTLVFYRRHV